jgi:hypothetical protein
MFAERLGLFVTDFSVPVVHDGQTARALFDQPTRGVLEDMVIDTEPAITLPAATLPVMARGEAITVAGVGYIVREVQLLDDGAMKRITLRAA